MKKIKFFGMLFAAAALSFTATSCGEDMDLDQIVEEIEQGNIKPSANIKESSNELVLTIKIPKLRTEVHTAKFSDGVCVSYVEKITSATQQFSDDTWSAITRYGQIVAGGLIQDGKTVTWDRTKEFSGESYEEIQAKFVYRKLGVEQLDGQVLFAY